MLSYWEQQSFINYEFIIIGAGLVGMNTAFELREKHPLSRILVLERGFISKGASTKNAGFACMGSLSELISDLKYSTEEEVLQLFNARKNGLERLRKRLGDGNIGFQTNGSYEVLDNKNTFCLESLDYLNQLLKPISNKNTFQISNKITQFGFDKEFCKVLIENMLEGEIDTGKMMRALYDYAMEYKIEVKSCVEVDKFEDNHANVNVYIKNTFNSENWVLKCKQLIICSNAFTNSLLHQEDITPGRGQVLITKPIKELKIKGIFHFNEGYYYFRAIDNRILLGGGRNLDFETETSTDFELNPYIQSELENLLRNQILPQTPLEIEQKWVGIMAFGKTKSPINKQVSKNVFGCFRMGGMGVALACEQAHTLVHKTMQIT